MSYVTQLLLVLTSHAVVKTEIRRQMEQLWKDHREALEQTVLEFVQAEISPETMFDFETRIAERVRELARQLVENVLAAAAVTRRKMLENEHRGDDPGEQESQPWTDRLPGHRLEVPRPAVCWLKFSSCQDVLPARGNGEGHRLIGVP